MRPIRRMFGWSLALAAALVLLPPRGEAFANAKIREVIDNPEMPTLQGGRHKLLGEAKANVFVFFRPGQAFSRSALIQIARFQKEMAGESVRWVAIVSDSYPAQQVEDEVQAVGLTCPVLIDRGDALYGKLGVDLHPVVGIADAQHRLVAYQPFTEINFADVVRARIRFALGEISRTQLEEVLHPRAATQSSDPQVAHRYYKLGQMLFKLHHLNKALEAAKRSIALDNTQAASHSLLGAILAAQGNCGEALAAFDRALALDKKDAQAVEGKKDCAGK